MKETMNNNYGTEEKILVIAIDHLRRYPDIDFVIAPPT